MEDTFDFVVVGAGPAGCAVAARLAQSAGRPTVALVEAGPERTPMLSNVPLGLTVLVTRRGRYNYAYKTVPQPELGGRRGYQPRGRGVGGSSLINAMICVRGQPEDYDAWAKAGCEGWGWADVLPVFKRLEDHALGENEWRGIGGPLRVDRLTSPSPASFAFVRAGVEAGFPENQDFNGATQEGVGFYEVFQKGGRRYNAGQAYLRGGLPMQNLRVIADRRARRVIIADGRAVGVEVGGRDDAATVRARREVILAGGTFGSPQLLMLSGIGPADHLIKLGIDVIADAPGVGGNLQDHVAFTWNFRTRARGLFGFTAPTLLQGAGSIPSYLASGRGMLTTNVAEAGGFVRSCEAADRPDLQLHFCVSLIDDHNRKLQFSRGMALHVCGLRPKSRGSLLLSSADPEAGPVIDPRFLSDPDDLETLVRGVKIARRILEAPALAALRGRPLHNADLDDDEALRAMIRAHADSIYHPVGTCRMGADSLSVVDARLRVRGVEALRVADASIMPTLISGNTQAATAMIGERAADMILAA